MKLTYEQIKSAAWGVSRVEEKDGYIQLFRFTKDQEELYKTVKEDFYNKTFATAGVRLGFKTNSKKLSLTAIFEQASSRTYFAVDVKVNGELIGMLDNCGGGEVYSENEKENYALGEYKKEFELPEGENEVIMYFPWSCRVKISEISLDDGASFVPVRREKQILMIGDSITQGYCAVHPSRRYAALLADTIGAEERNKAIGGEVFRPELASLRDENYEPDYITVAYGTNDWSSKPREFFIEKCRGFYEALAKNYPNSKIFAIAPIWRADLERETAYGKFSDVAKDIESIVAKIENVTFINAFDCVPEEEKYFADLYLHPNDAGFEHYAKNLAKKIKQYI